VAILKARNAAGMFVDGSVGKCFAYGAQRGRFLVQGGADARAAIRLSGAQVLFGGDLRGFAFEYMTGGTAVVLGDPGRWICSGMSGGVVFLRHDPTRGLDDAALHDRFAKGAKVHMRAPRDEDLPALREMIDAYADALRDSDQPEAANHVRGLVADPSANFRAVRPGADITDQNVSTE
jgi:glutamate synthase (NADPH) large chain